MKKIMFNDKYGLTKAVIDGKKTQTRRIVEGHTYVNPFATLCQGKLRVNEIHKQEEISRFSIGEEVAIAQSYHALNKLGYMAPEGLDHYCEGSAGYDNKMFVRADLMPHHIKITSIRVERLQDISEEDCLKEGIKRKNERYCVENYKGVCFYTNDPKLAFRCLIDKTCGKGTWERNPWVFVYDFELID